MGGFAAAMGQPWDEAKLSIDSDPAWGWVHLQQTTPGFWADLKFLPGALSFWNTLTGEFPRATVNILTAYPGTKCWNNPTPEQRAWIEHGKIKWMVKHLDVLPKRLYMCHRHEKQTFAGVWTVLIDDNATTIREFSDRGGYSIKFVGDHTQPLREIRALYGAYIEAQDKAQSVA